MRTKTLIKLYLQGWCFSIRMVLENTRLIFRKIFIAYLGQPNFDVINLPKHG